MMPTWAWVTCASIWFGVSFIVYACLCMSARASRTEEKRTAAGYQVALDRHDQGGA